MPLGHKFLRVDRARVVRGISVRVDRASLHHDIVRRLLHRPSRSRPCRRPQPRLPSLPVQAERRASRSSRGRCRRRRNRRQGRYAFSRARGRAYALVYLLEGLRDLGLEERGRGGRAALQGMPCGCKGRGLRARGGRRGEDG